MSSKLGEGAPPCWGVLTLKGLMGLSRTDPFWIRKLTSLCHHRAINALTFLWAGPGPGPAPRHLQPQEPYLAQSPCLLPSAALTWSCLREGDAGTEESQGTDSQAACPRPCSFQGSPGAQPSAPREVNFSYLYLQALL